MIWLLKTNYKKPIMNKLQNRSLYFFIIVIISFLFFRGRLGSDDIEVFNFVESFITSEITLKQFLSNIDFYRGQLSETNNVQLFTSYTWGHRFIWIIQTFIITKIIYVTNIFFDFDKLFLAQYFSGYILSFYSFFSYLLIYLYLKKDNSIYYSFFLSSVIFFGTGLISFFTGSYIESLVLLLFVLREISKVLYKKIFCDLFIILIKPYYFIYIVFLYFCETKNLILNTKISIFLLLMYFVIKLAVNSISPENDVDVLFSFLSFSDLNLIVLFSNLFKFYFSYGVGVFFTSTILIILIFFGYNKNTNFKIIGLFFLSIFLSFWDGFHGYAPGGRYFLPILLTFLPEVNSGFNFLIKNLEKIKFRFLSFIILTLLIFNLPVLEYRNTNLTSYLNDSVYKKNVINDMTIKENEVVKENTPIESLSYNHIIFSNKVILYKLLNINQVIIESHKIELNTIYPMTGLARLIFISNNKIIIYGKKLKEFSDKNKIYFVSLYFLISLIYLFLIFFCFFNLVYQNKKK